MIEVKNLCKSFEDKDVLIDINATFENGNTWLSTFFLCSVYSAVRLDHERLTHQRIDLQSKEPVTTTSRRRHETGHSSEEPKVPMMSSLSDQCWTAEESVKTACSPTTSKTGSPPSSQASITS